MAGPPAAVAAVRLGGSPGARRPAGGRARAGRRIGWAGLDGAGSGDGIRRTAARPARRLRLRRSALERGLGEDRALGGGRGRRAAGWSRRSSSTRRRRAPRARRATPAAVPCSSSPSSSRPARSCSATRWTIRPRPSCCGWPGEAALDRWRRWPPATGSGGGRCSDCAATLVRTSCTEAGLPTWEDPSNADPAFARSRVRTQVLPMLETHPRARHRRVAGAQRRPAAGRRRRARRAGRGLSRGDRDGDLRDPRAWSGWPRWPAAVRSRVLRAAALQAGCPPTDLSAAHVGGARRVGDRLEGARAA